MNQHEVRLSLVDHIAEMMFQMSDPDETAGNDEMYLENYREFASHILDSLQMTVTESDGNVHKVSLAPLEPIAYVDKVLAEEEQARKGE